MPDRANGLECPTLAEVGDFIAQNDARFDGRLSRYHNYSRVVSLCHFDQLVERDDLRQQAHVGVVSGSKSEPELRLLSAGQVSVLSFEDDPRFDLDVEWPESAAFSLTLCNQVLEHVFHPHVAFANLCRVTRPGGALYVSIPSINCIHAEPHYYSAGYHPRFLDRLGRENGCQLLGLGAWGSLKYMLHAVSGRWLTARQLGRGLNSRFDIDLPLHMLADGRKNMALEPAPIMTDCWALFRRADGRR